MTSKFNLYEDLNEPTKRLKYLRANKEEGSWELKYGFNPVGICRRDYRPLVTLHKVTFCLPEYFIT